jgi:hypothetical protein
VDWHADPLFYVLSQVVNGKTVLVDLPSQYGLWVELIAPLFQFSSASVQNVSGLFAVLQLTSLLVLYFVLFKLIKQPLLLAMGGIALIVITFGTFSLFSNIKDPYFQYWPIRSFWPMLSVFIFFRFVQRTTFVSSILMSVVGALGLFWNADTGLFVVLAFGAFLVSKLMMVLALNRRKYTRVDAMAWSPKQFIFAIAAHVGVTFFILAILFTLLMVKSGEVLNFSWLFEYQKIFFGLGLFMIPLPRQVHPWMPVLGVYLLGLLVSIRSWTSTMDNKRMDVVYYLSVLGLGLFFYYQGRSHILNLISVSWPAVLISMILTDESLRAIRAKLLPKIQVVLPITFVAILLICCISFSAHIESMVFGVMNPVTSRGLEYSSLVSNELAFIKERSGNKQECIILSKRQGIYHAESGLVSPFKGPSLVEMVLKSDQDRLITQVLNGKLKCLYFGVGRYSDAALPLNLQMLQGRYSIVATNSMRTMVYLEQKLEPY